MYIKAVSKCITLSMLEHQEYMLASVGLTSDDCFSVGEFEIVEFSRLLVSSTYHHYYYLRVSRNHMYGFW